MGLGPGEIVLILIIAYVVVGPEDMGKLARTMAKAMRQLRKLSTDLGEDINLPAVPDLSTGLEKTVPGPAEITTGTVLKAVPGLSETENTLKDAAGSAVSDLDSVLIEIEKAERGKEQCSVPRE